MVIGGLILAYRNNGWPRINVSAPGVIHLKNNYSRSDIPRKAYVKGEGGEP